MTTRLGRRRLRHNLIIAGCVLAGGWSGVTAAGTADPTLGLSLTTGYLGMALFAATLAVRPWRGLTGRSTPVSLHLRRDLGIWASALTGAHIWIGFQRHMGGRALLYLFHPGDGGGTGGVRLDTFGLANWIGLGAAAVSLVLLSTSNDVSLARLGTRRWKAVQRWNYVVLPMVAVHAVAYQLLQDRGRIWVLAGAAPVLLAVALRATDRWRATRGGGPAPPS